MKKGYAHICLVLDGSGSMNAIKEEVKNALDAFVEQQRQYPGQTVLDVYVFSDDSRRIVHSLNLARLDEELEFDYSPRGCTALNDAACDAIDDLGREFAEKSEEERPELVVVAIITDGQENASKRRRREDLKERIERQFNAYQWRFVFLAANMSAQEVGTSLGVRSEHCVDFEATPEGLKKVRWILCERLAWFRAERIGW